MDGVWAKEKKRIRMLIFPTIELSHLKDLYNIIFYLDLPFIWHCESPKLNLISSDYNKIIQIRSPLYIKYSKWPLHEF